MNKFIALGEKARGDKELKYFPNKKTTINFNEFCQLFNEALSQKDLQEEMLLNCFYAFDYNQYHCNFKFFF